MVLKDANFVGQRLTGMLGASDVLGIVDGLPN
jgi:hypothetical protein